MWASMFQSASVKTIKLLQDILNVVKDILVLISDFYHSEILDWLIKVMPNLNNEHNESPSI